LLDEFNVLLDITALCSHRIACSKYQGTAIAIHNSGDVKIAVIE